MNFRLLNITRLGIEDLETHNLGVQQLSVASLNMQMSAPTEIMLCLTLLSFILTCLSTMCYHRYHVAEMQRMLRTTGGSGYDRMPARD